MASTQPGGVSGTRAPMRTDEDEPSARADPGVEDGVLMRWRLPCDESVAGHPDRGTGRRGGSRASGPLLPRDPVVPLIPLIPVVPLVPPERGRTWVMMPAIASATAPHGQAIKAVTGRGTSTGRSLGTPVGPGREAGRG